MKYRWAGGLGMAFIIVAQGNEVVEYSLDDKIAQSQVVVIGRVLSTSKIEFPDKNLSSVEYANVETLSGMRGADVGEIIKVAFKFGVSELEPDCCLVGGGYLFFISRKEDGLYYSVNGPYGIYKIDQKR